MKHYVFWTNRPEDYLCIEPTFLGPYFDLVDTGRVNVPPKHSVGFDFDITIPKLSLDMTYLDIDEAATAGI